MQERKHSLTEKKFQSDVSNLKLFEKTVVSFTIDDRVPAKSDDNNRLYDMAVVEGNKVWVVVLAIYCNCLISKVTSIIP